jgi:hypothetical protein
MPLRSTKNTPPPCGCRRLRAIHVGDARFFGAQSRRVPPRTISTAYPTRAVFYHRIKFPCPGGWTLLSPTPPRPHAPSAPAGIRRKLKASTLLFAASLNVEPVTVRSWEKGHRSPSSSALRFSEAIFVPFWVFCGLSCLGLDLGVNGQRKFRAALSSGFPEARAW